MRVIGGVVLLTGALCAFQIRQLLLWSLWGAPTHPIQYVAFWGAILLAISGLVLLAGFRPALWASLIGLAMSWAYYAPALAVSLGGIGSRPVSSLYVLTPPSLLLLWSSFLVIRELFARRRTRTAGAEDASPHGSDA